MIRLAYRFYRLLTWILYWAPRRFTPAGVFVVGGMLICAVIGVDMDQSVAIQGAVLAASLLAVSSISSRFFRGRFSATRRLPRFGCVGQSIAYSVEVTNHSAKRLDRLEITEDLEDPRLSFNEFASNYRAGVRRRSFRLARSGSMPFRSRRAVVKFEPLAVLPREGSVELRLELLPLKRGPLRFTGLTIAQTDPLGLFRALAPVPLPQSLIVLPKRYRLPALALPGARTYQHGGLALASAIGDSEEFVSLRDYRPGDPMRHIHWRSWPRFGRPVVREFQDEFFVRHALILDTFAGPRKAEAFEEAVAVAASFACAIDTQESLLDLMFVGTRAVSFTTGRGLGQAQQALEILASANAIHEGPFSDLQNLVLQHAGALCGCVCVFLDWDKSRREMVRRLRALGLPVLPLVVGDADLAEKIRTDDDPEGSGMIQMLKIGSIEQCLQELEFAWK